MSKTDPHCRYCDSTDLYVCEICHEERMLHYQTTIEDLKWDLEHATGRAGGTSNSVRQTKNALAEATKGRRHDGEKPHPDADEN